MKTWMKVTSVGAIVLGFLISAFAPAASIDLRSGTGWPSAGKGRTYVFSETVDFSDDNATANDIVGIMNIPSGAFVSKVVAEVETVEGGTLTIDVGDFTVSGTTFSAVDADGYIDGFSCNTTTTLTASSLVSSVAVASTGTVTLASTMNVAYGLGKWYPDGGIIGVVPKNNADAAVVTIKAFVVRFDE